MIIKCFRCGKDLESPDAFKADYVIASDTVIREPREVLFALKHNQATLEKAAMMAAVETYLAEDGVAELTRPKYPGLTITDSEYDQVEIPNPEGARLVDQSIKVIVSIEERDIQKTGIVCPDCYRDTDFAIWGIHKGMEKPEEE